MAMITSHTMKTFPKMAILSFLMPVSVYLSHIGANSILVFIITGIAMIGLIDLLQKSVGEISIYSGPVVGGLLQATLGNFPELIISLTALHHGMHVLMKGALIGSIIGNILLIVGLAMFIGGLKHKTQRFSRVGTNASILVLVFVLVALFVPSYVVTAGKMDPMIKETAASAAIDITSLCISILLLIGYILYLIFSLKTHRSAYTSEVDPKVKPEWKKGLAIVVLFVGASLIGFESDILVTSIEGMLSSTKSVFSQLFMGVIFVAAIGNASATTVSINMARKNNMDLSFQVAVGASIQIALLVIPLLVIYSYIIGKPFTLVFGGLELISVGACVLVCGYSLLDGDSNWFEGALFVIVYLILAVAFFFCT